MVRTRWVGLLAVLLLVVGGTAQAASTPAASTPVAEPGSEGPAVADIQARLVQLALLKPPVTGHYGKSTERAVKAFQKQRHFPQTGIVGNRAYQRLVDSTRTPSETDLANLPGVTLYGPGSDSRQVRKAQARLRQLKRYAGNVTNHYNKRTTKAVEGFQTKRHLPVTGELDRLTLDVLKVLTRKPTKADLANAKPDAADGRPLDERCTTGRVLCVDKTSQSLRWVIDNKVKLTLDARFGRPGFETREGAFSVYRKSRDHVSTIYDTSMPFAMFFSGGQAVHYSPDFAAVGYNGASHGCVNIRDYNAIASLFDEVAIGTKVIVYRS